MKKTLTLVSALLISTSASAQMNLPILGQLGAGNLDAGSGLLSSFDIGGIISSSIQDDPLNIVNSAIELQALGAPFLVPVLLQVAPLVDAGPALPFLAPVLGGGANLPGLPNLDFLM